jgi:hypothetical protein
MKAAGVPLYDVQSDLSELLKRIRLIESRAVSIGPVFKMDIH